MAIKINWQDLLKRYINWQEIVRVYKNGSQVRPWTPSVWNYLYFDVYPEQYSYASVRLNYSWNNPPAQLEISLDKINRSDYTLWTSITFSSQWRVYWRNKSTTQTLFSSSDGHYTFSLSDGTRAWWDVNYLLCKNGTTDLTASWDSCFSELFYLADWLITPPTLSATTLTDYCYSGMFSGCENLTTAPLLPATILSTGCYSNMFERCESLTTAPILSSTTLADYCYSGMFSGSWLTTAPLLPATTLANYCYSWMFSGSNITTAPVLPATTLAEGCYSGMFSGSSLVTPPALSATTLAPECYSEMFYECGDLTSIPALPALTIPYSAYAWMFTGCGNIKISETQTGEYQTPYRIPTTWTWVADLYSTANTFVRTGWTFTWTPTINTTYYTSNTIIS